MFTLLASTTGKSEGEKIFITEVQLVQPDSYARLCLQEEQERKGEATAEHCTVLICLFVCVVAGDISVPVMKSMRMLLLLQSNRCPLQASGLMLYCSRSQRSQLVYSQTKPSGKQIEPKLIVYVTYTD